MIAELFLRWLNSLPAAVLLAVVSWAALRWMKSTGAPARHAAWWAVLAGVVALPLIPLARDAWPASTAVVEGRSAPVAQAFQAGFPEQAAGSEEVRPTRSIAARFELVNGAWLGAVVAVWALLAMAQLTRLALCYFALRALKTSARPAPEALRIEAAEWALEAGVRRDFRLLVSSDIETPVAVGFRHPAVILPSGLLAVLGKEDLSHVMLHEIAHLDRRDDWTNLLLRGLAGLLALHPVAHWVIRRIDRERELACDDWVVDATGQARPYAVSLARLLELNAVHAAPVLASGMGLRGSDAGSRIERLLRHHRPGTKRSSLPRLVLAGLLFVGMAVAVGSLPPFAAWARETQPPAEPSKQTPAPAPSAAAEPAPKKQSGPSRPVPVVAPAPSGEPEGYLAMLHKAGYSDLSVDEIIELKIHGVDGRFIREMSEAGFGRLTPRQLKELRIHGVNPGQAREAKRFKPNATVEQVIQMKIAGVI